MNGDVTIKGNELNGYVVVQRVEGEWRAITKRFVTYDEASEAIAHIEVGEAK